MAKKSTKTKTTPKPAKRRPAKRAKRTAKQARLQAKAAAGGLPDIMAQVAADNVRANAPPTVRTPAVRAIVLAAVADGWSVTKAAAEAGIARSTVFAWIKDDEQFGIDYNEAYAAGLEVAEDEIRRRGHGFKVPTNDFLLDEDGSIVLDPLTGKGVRLYEEKYSDALLMRIAVSRDAVKWADRSKTESKISANVKVSEVGGDADIAAFDAVEAGDAAVIAAKRKEAEALERAEELQAELDRMRQASTQETNADASGIE